MTITASAALLRGRLKSWVYYGWACIHSGIMAIERIKISLTVKEQNLHSWETKVKDKQSCSKWTRRSLTPSLVAKIKPVTAITAGKRGGEVVQKGSKFLLIFFHCGELSTTSRELWQLHSTCYIVQVRNGIKITKSSGLCNWEFKPMHYLHWWITLWRNEHFVMVIH